MKKYSRQLVLLLLVLPLLFATAAPAQTPAYPATARVSNISLWPGVAPGSESAPQQEKYSLYGTQGHRVFWSISRPLIVAFYAAKPNGSAVMVIPGGGYRALYFDSPPVEVARWLNTLGVDAFVLKHRLPDEGHAKGYNVPLQDAQRAIRLIRSGTVAASAGHSLDPARIGVMGFSAGGHLSAVLGMYYNEKVYDPVDSADAVSARPDFMLLGYPALEMPPLTAADVMPNKYRMYHKYYIERRISASSPPAFVFHGDRDTSVPYFVSVHLVDALKDAGVPAELHILPGAGHGFGIDANGPEAAWPDLCAAWLRSRGIIPAVTQ
jgi:acetyl esterase/lipase